MKPTLTYCDTVLLCLSTSNSRRLERLQVGAEKCVYGGSTPVRRWPSIESERNRQAILFMYKCMNGLGPEIFYGYFQRFNHGKRTRVNGINLELPKAKLKAFRKSIKHQGPLLFNKLPAELKSETSLLLFKSYLKSYFNSLS